MPLNTLCGYLCCGHPHHMLSTSFCGKIYNPLALWNHFYCEFDDILHNIMILQYCHIFDIAKHCRCALHSGLSINRTLYLLVYYYTSPYHRMAIFAEVIPVLLYLMTVFVCLFIAVFLCIA